MPGALTATQPRVKNPVLLPLGWARASFGLVFLLRTTPLVVPLDPKLVADAWPLWGWPIAPTPAIYGLSLPPAIVQALCIARTLGALGMCLGVGSRPAALLASFCGFAVLAQNAFAFSFTQYLLCLGSLFFAVGDGGAAFALCPERSHSSRSSYGLIRALVASIYFWAGYCKLRWDWVDGRTIRLFHDEHRLSGRLADVLLATPGRSAVVATAILFTELSLPLLLLVRRTRLMGVAIALSMHIGIEICARPETIGWTMISLLLAFLPPPTDDNDNSLDGPGQRTQRAASAGQTQSP